MGIRIPAALGQVAAVAGGQNFPQGDETALDGLGDAWQQLGATINQTADRFDPVTASVLDSVQGDPADSFRTYATELRDQVPPLIMVANQIAAMAHRTAAVIRAGKQLIIEQLARLDVELAYLAATGQGAVYAAVAINTTAASIESIAGQIAEDIAANSISEGALTDELAVLGKIGQTGEPQQNLKHSSAGNEGPGQVKVRTGAWPSLERVGANVTNDIGNTELNYNGYETIHQLPLLDIQRMKLVDPGGVENVAQMVLAGGQQVTALPNQPGAITGPAGQSSNMDGAPTGGGPVSIRNTLAAPRSVAEPSSPAQVDAPEPVRDEEPPVMTQPPAAPQTELAPDDPVAHLKEVTQPTEAPADPAPSPAAVRPAVPTASTEPPGLPNLPTRLVPQPTPTARHDAPADPPSIPNPAPEQPAVPAPEVGTPQQPAPVPSPAPAAPITQSTPPVPNHDAVVSPPPAETMQPSAPPPVPSHDAAVSPQPAETMHSSAPPPSPPPAEAMSPSGPPSPPPLSPSVPNNVTAPGHIPPAETAPPLLHQPVVQQSAPVTHHTTAQPQPPQHDAPAQQDRSGPPPTATPEPAASSLEPLPMFPGQFSEVSADRPYTARPTGIDEPDDIIAWPPGDPDEPVRPRARRADPLRLITEAPIVDDSTYPTAG